LLTLILKTRLLQISAVYLLLSDNGKSVAIPSVACLSFQH